MRVTIKLKLGLAFGAVILLSAIMAGFGIGSLSSLNTTLDNLVQGPVQRTRLTDQLASDLLRLVRAEKNLLLAEKEQGERYVAEIEKLRESLSPRIEKAVSTASAENRREMGCVPTAFKRYVGVQDKITDLVRHDQQAQGRTHLGRAGPAARDRCGKAARRHRRGEPDPHDERRASGRPRIRQFENAAVVHCLGCVADRRRDRCLDLAQHQPRARPHEGACRRRRDRRSRPAGRGAD